MYYTLRITHLQNSKDEDTEYQNYSLIKQTYKDFGAYFFSQAKESISYMQCCSSTRGPD